MSDELTWVCDCPTKDALVCKEHPDCRPSYCKMRRFDQPVFLERQAYIEKCELEIRESEAKVAASKALYEEINIRLEAFWLQYNLEMTTLIYRGMFDPNFCKPAGVDGG